MRITEIDLNNEKSKVLGIDVGLDTIKMSRLGKVVVLAGANGAGKTRLLKTITHILAKRAHQGKYEDLNNSIDAWNTLLAQRNLDANYVENLQQSITQYQQLLSAYETVVTEPVNATKVTMAEFVPKKLNLQNPEALSNEMLISHFMNFITLGLQEANVKAPAYIKKIMEAAFNASHPDMSLNITQNEINDAKLKKNELVSLIELVFGKKSNPYYNLQGQVCLFGRADYVGALSDGQKVLLQMVAALHAQGANLAEAILLMDEPENHLHPAALIEVITRLQSLLANGQLWIATHSVPLIAHLINDEPNCLWYMDDAKVTYAGRKPELVLNGLLGGEQGSDKLQLFMQLPKQFAASRFLAECLLPPTTVGADTKDSQTNQITRVIKQFKANGLTRILDFGAGQGRLLPTLAIQDDSLLVTWLDYFAYDPFPNDKEICIFHLDQVYGNDSGRKRHFDSLQSLRASYDDGSFHLVVMCNVLHEIPPDEWLRDLGANSNLQNILADDGYLLIVEDYQMPVGEKAHKYGFMLLDTLELKKLFCINEEDCASQRYLVFDERPNGHEKGRLKAHLIHKKCLSRITSETRKLAIQELKRSSAQKIRTLQANTQADFRQGQLYALAAQQYTNATLWLGE